MAKLFSSFDVHGMTLKNRIVMSPMCMYSCANHDGKVMNWHKTHYTSRAVGQVGLILLEASAVTPQGRISESDLGIWSDEHIPGLEAQIVGIETRLTILEESQFSLEAGQKELFQISRAIRDRQEETDAKLEALSMDVHKLYGKVEDNGTKLLAAADELHRFRRDTKLDFHRLEGYIRFVDNAMEDASERIDELEEAATLAV